MVAKNKLVLVNPVNTVRSGFSVNQSSRFPPLGLGILAGLILAGGALILKLVLGVS